MHLISAVERGIRMPSSLIRKYSMDEISTPTSPDNRCACAVVIGVTYGTLYH